MSDVARTVGYISDGRYRSVPVITVLDPMPDDGTAVVIGDESGNGSLWIEWAHHGEVPVAVIAERSET